MWTGIVLGVYFGGLTALHWKKDKHHSRCLYIVAHVWFAAAVVIGSLK